MSAIVQGQLSQVRLLLGLNAEQVRELCDRIQAKSDWCSCEFLVLAVLDLAMRGRSYLQILQYLDEL